MEQLGAELAVTEVGEEAEGDKRRRARHGRSRLRAALGAAALMAVGLRGRGEARQPASRALAATTAAVTAVAARSVTVTVAAPAAPAVQATAMEGGRWASAGACAERQTLCREKRNSGGGSGKRGTAATGTVSRSEIELK